MIHSAERKVKVNKQKLIDTIKANKAKHIEEYNQAVLDYKEEADKKLRELRRNLNDGRLDLQLVMTTPQNKEEDYDKLITQFEWELNDTVELSQEEFNEYVHDDFDFARQARLSNTFYAKSITRKSR